MAVFLTAVALCSVAAQGAEAVKIGVLTVSATGQTQTRWQPLAGTLKRAMPDRSFVVAAMNSAEMDLAVAGRQLDFVLTSPEHYVVLAKRNGLRPPLATLATAQNGQRTTVFGGVIFTRQGQTGISTASDFQGKTIAAVDTESFAGYQIQAHELARSGLRLPQDAGLTSTGMPDERVVDAVMAGADVGFVRTGVLEDLARRGKLDMKQIRILNRKSVPGFPFEVSTPLYPEWPVVALPHVDDRLAAQVAATLFLLQENAAATRAMGIRGFSVPGDYSTVEDLLRERHLAPFEAVPQFTVHEAWAAYTLQIVGGILATGLILLLVRRWFMTKGNRAAGKGRVVQQKRRAPAKAESLLALLDTTRELLLELGLDGRCRACHSPPIDLAGAASGNLIGKRVADMLPPDAAGVVMASLHEANDRGESRRKQLALALPNGDKCVEFSVVRKDQPPNEERRFLVILRDISDRKEAEDRLRLAAAVFAHAREGIMVTAADGTIIDVNDTFSLITGYGRDEVLGRNPRILSSGRHEKMFFEAMWRALLEQGYWYGELWNRHRNGAEYAEKLTISAVLDAQGAIQKYVALFSDITRNTEHERELEHMAHYDALTTLPNRIVLADRLHQGMSNALQSGRGLAVCYLDLDGFKRVNDIYGHDTGDRLLMVVASRMKKELREGDTLARIGGDEFVAVLLDRPDFEASAPTLTAFLSATAQPVRINNDVLQVSASLGVACYPQTDPVDAEQLLRQAHQAMYQAKLAGKNRYCVFDAEQDRSLRGNYENLEHVRNALFAQEFVLYFQPKVNLRTGIVVGAEALIRWQHPQRGLLVPGDFLPLIEDHALAIDLGEWVIRSVLKQLCLWQDVGLDLPVSVNVGARQLQQPDFIDHLLAIMAEHPAVRPGRLMIEVLETSVLEDLAHVSQIMERCREFGVEFALDDFGTGYSSLTYLKRLPVTALKIDQSFVRGMLDDPDDLSILEGILGLASAFRREVIAEGVETVEHGEMLLQLGCELAQGNGIARAMPAAEVPRWAAAWRADPTWRKRPAVSRDDLPLLFASTEHRAWLAALETHLKGGRESPPTLDCHQCRFGQWLVVRGATRDGTQTAFQTIEHLHREMHASATELCRLHSQGIRVEPEQLSEVHRLLGALIEEVRVLLV